MSTPDVTVVASHLVYIFSILYILFVFYVFMCIINEPRAHMQKKKKYIYI